MGCRTLPDKLEWMDGMPVVFNYPLLERPNPEAFILELSDGSQVKIIKITKNIEKCLIIGESRLCDADPRDGI